MQYIVIVRLVRLVYTFSMPFYFLNIKSFDYLVNKIYNKFKVIMQKKLKRDPVKYIRDIMKSSYKARECCYICGTTENIELHHLYSVAELWNYWAKTNRIVISTDQDILECRDRFVKENELFLSNDNLYSLCKAHHQRLHSLYGKSYSNYMAKRVKAWLDIQKQKSGEF